MLQRNYFFCCQQRMKYSFLIICACLAFSVSCKKKTENRFDCGEPVVCPAVVCVAFWSNFNFTIVDGQTGADLIYGSNPTLTAADIKLYIKSNSPYTQVQLINDVDKKQLRTMSAADTMAIQIKDEPLQYILVKNFCANECCSRTAVEIVHEGNFMIADKQKLFRFKRS